MEISHSFGAAVRGYHRKYWQPIENERSSCMHEAGNPFDRFAIKTVKENGEIVVHLPREISRVTKFYLDRGATMYCESSATHYRRSPLVQGGLEIARRVIVKMRATKLNQRLSEHYMQLVAQIYSDPAVDTVVGSIFNLVMTFSPPTSQPNSERQAEARGSGKKKVVGKGSQGSSRDIREMIASSSAPAKQKKKTTRLPLW